MKLSILMAGAALAAFATAANANAVYSNPYDGSGNGDCSWSTTCAATVGRGDDFAAQEFTLTTGATVVAASFEEVPGFSSGQVTDVSWGFLAADGTGGSPGTILQAGTDSVYGYGTGGNGSIKGYFTTGPIYLAPGTYYFALQGDSSSFTEYLAEGVAGSGAYNSQDGGVSWNPGYFCQGGGDCMPSIAVSLYDTVPSVGGVPEPASWAMLMVGFAGAGALMRRRAKAVA